MQKTNALFQFTISNPDQGDTKASQGYIVIVDFKSKEARFIDWYT
jgi:hypothetical protein